MLTRVTGRQGVPRYEASLPGYHLVTERVKSSKGEDLRSGCAFGIRGVAEKPTGILGATAEASACISSQVCVSWREGEGVGGSEDSN